MPKQIITLPHSTPPIAPFSAGTMADGIVYVSGWDYALVDALTPQPGDIVLAKPRYSGFFNTQLDSLLRSAGIHHLVFTGIATNVCVESTLRDSFFLEYFSVVLEDATHQAGPTYTQQAALYNIETFFGWVSDVDHFCHAVAEQHPPLEKSA